MIDIAEAARSAAESLRSHTLRSFLAMLGIIFGVGAVIAMLSIGAGAEREALALIDSMGLRNVIIRAKDPDRENDRQEIRKKSPGLAPRDALAIREAVPGVESVVSELEVEAWKVFSHGGRARPQVKGVSHELPSFLAVALREGRFFDARDEETFAPVCVIGAEVRRDLFGFGPAVSRAVKVNDQWLTVIGTIVPAGERREIQRIEVTTHDDKIYVPVTTARARFARDTLKSPLDAVTVRFAAGTPVQETAAVVKGLLDRLHGGADDFALVVPEALLEQSQRTQRLFDVVMGAIASISLLVGGIGIMNIMLATVLERTREIGVRRAVGARQADIRNQFVIESFAITLAGGVLGILLGVAIARLVAAYAGWNTIVTPLSILVSVGVSAAVGLAFGIYPALRAARDDPIESLRYE